MLRNKRLSGSKSMLHVMSLHDTMAARMCPGGAIANLRAPAERLPRFVSLGNRGNACGDPIPGLGEATTMPAAELRRIASALRAEIAMPSSLAARDIGLNRVYTGGWETKTAGARIRAVADASRASGELWAYVGAYMAEFAREALLDPPALAALRAPGEGWPPQTLARVDQIARLLKAAYDCLRDGVEDSLGAPAF